MESSNFWLEHQSISYAVVNGLIGSITLWAFWVPFITFLAQPVASAIMKQDICSAINQFDTPTVLPYFSGLAGKKLIEDDVQDSKDLNTGTLASLWLLAGLSITISLWIVTSIIKNGRLDVGHIILFNSILFVIIITIELAFFIGVGLKFIPFNLRDMFDNVIQNLEYRLFPFENGPTVNPIYTTSGKTRNLKMDRSMKI